MEDSKEYFWGVELSRSKPEYTWTFEDEDDDADYIINTLFIKVCTLGASAVSGERNLIEVETRAGPDKKTLVLPFTSLTLGQNDMCTLDVSFGDDVPVTFRLAQGSGPVSLTGLHLIEFPEEPEEEYDSQEDASMLEEAREDDLDVSEDEDEDEEEESPKKPSKRKAGKPVGKKSKKVKLTESASSTGDSEEEDEDDEDSMEEDEESPVKADKKKKNKNKDGAKPTKVKMPKVGLKKSPRAVKVTKKAGKVGKK